MKDAVFYFDSSRFSGIIPCQLKVCEELAVAGDEWLCARLRCFRRRSFIDRLLHRHPVEYSLVLYGAAPPPAGLYAFIRPFLSDGVCMLLRWDREGERKIPRRIVYCDPLGEIVQME